MNIIIAFFIGFILAFGIFGNIFRKRHELVFHYPDGSWVKGIRKWNFRSQETRGTHHIIVTGGSPEFKDVIGLRIACPIDTVKYFSFIC